MNTLLHEGKLLLLNKPYGWTSFDLVNKVRRVAEYHYKIKRRNLKVGHAGTLDPLATGLMLICTGKMTRAITTFQDMDKEYTGTITLGASTASFDMEKQTDEVFETAHITEEDIYAAARSFLGKQEQMPPAFSAKQVDGVRAYEMARKGEEVKLKPVSIEIKDFEITGINMPEVNFRIVCSKGTYIRSIARDFGNYLKSGAYLSKLERTAIGSHKLSNALEVADFEKLVKSGAFDLPSGADSGI